MFTTEDKIKSQVDSVQYHRFPGTYSIAACLTLKNGFTVVGCSHCAIPAEFDESLGQQYAYDEALNQVWELEAYVFRNKVAELD